MKKIILVLMMVLVAVPAFAGIFVKAEYGNGIESENRDIYFAGFKLGYRFTFWNIQSETSYEYLNWSYRDGINGNPFEDIYTAEQKFKYNIFFIRARHYCAHPVCSHNSEVLSRPIGNDYWAGSISTISIGLEYEFNFK